MAENQTEKKALTRAQKTDATKEIVRELLAMKPTKHNELIEEVAKQYVLRYGEEGENVNDVKGRVGSVLDIMQKNSDVMYDGGMYALKARMPLPPTAREVVSPAEKTEEKTVKKTTRSKTKKAKEASAKEEAPALVEEAPKAKSVKKPTKKAKEKGEETATAPEAPATEQAEAPAPKKRGRKAKVEEKAEKKEAVTEKAEEVPVKEETVTSPAEEKKKKPAAKRAAREKKPVEIPVDSKVEEKKEEVAAEVSVKQEEKLVEEKAAEEKPATEQAEVPAPKKETQLTVKPKGEIVQRELVDMSFLLGDKVAKAPQKKAEPVKAEVALEKMPSSTAEGKPVTPKKEESAEAPVVKVEAPAEKVAPQRGEKKERPQPILTAKKEEGKILVKESKEEKPARNARGRGKSGVKAQEEQTPDERLKESFLKKMRSLGGDYFEYYSVYLLERYSIKNGRRLEGLRISGGDHDGGIDGEIELTDALGFKETIYIQSKNWDPDKGKEEKWVVGETLLQQFIGACACRQAKDGRLHARGIFITTSRFTPEAKRILEDMADKLVGYDGSDLYEAAKECEFGLVKKNGEWTLDEKLLSGPKAFFHL